jgi:CRISPR-associated protein Cas1
MNGLEDLDPIPVKDRASLAYVEKGRIDVRDGAFVVIDKNGVRTQIPVGGLTGLMLEPGTRISHAAVGLAAEVGCLLMWIGEAGVRLYSAGLPGGARTDNLVKQARLALNEETRRAVVRNMFAERFGEEPEEGLRIEQLRGMEGARVRQMYQNLANQYGINWEGRDYDPDDWSEGDLANRCLSASTAALYGVTEAAILAGGYSPSLGFLHTGKRRSFVFDVADLFKFDVAVPAAFEVVAENPPDPSGEVRRRCRDRFRDTDLLERIIPTIHQILDEEPSDDSQAPDWVIDPAFGGDEEEGDT